MEGGGVLLELHTDPDLILPETEATLFQYISYHENSAAPGLHFVLFLAFSSTNTDTANQIQ